MKRLAPLALISFCAATAQATCPTSPDLVGNVVTACDGTDVEVQKAVNATTTAGNIVVVPLAGQPIGGWVWQATVVVNRPYNITIRGDDGQLQHQPTVQQGGNSAYNMILLNPVDPAGPKTTARITNINFVRNNAVPGDQVKGSRILVDGVTTIDDSTVPWKGGFRVDHCKFSDPFYDNSNYTLNQCYVAAGSKSLRCEDAFFEKATDCPDQYSGRVIWDTGGTVFPKYSFCRLSSLRSTIPNVTVTAGSANITATASAPFDPSDAGVPVTSGSLLQSQTTIQSVTDGTHAVLNKTASTTNAAATLTLGQAKIATLSVAAAGAGLTNQALNFSGTTQRLNVGWVSWKGWVFGVIDHNECSKNPLRFNNASTNMGQGSDPTGVGMLGDYMQGFLPPGKNELGGSIWTVVYEDNIIEGGTGGATDMGSEGDLGSAAVTFRHNTTFGSFASHGSRETGTTGHASRLMEYYNNLFVLLDYSPPGAMEMRADTSAIEPRNAEQIIYNNRLVGGNNVSIGTSSLGGVAAETGPTWAGSVSNQPQGALRSGYCADGVCAWDLNKKGQFTDPVLGMAHWPDTGYTATKGPGLGILTGPNPSPTPGNTDAQDVVSAGVDSDWRFGDVYGHVNLSGTELMSSTRVTTTGLTALSDIQVPNNVVWKLSNVVVQGTNLSGTAGQAADSSHPIPQNYFRGFCLRNADQPRWLGAGKNDQTGSFFVIVGNTTGDTTKGGANIELYALGPQATADQTPQGPLNITNGQHLEFRFVSERWGVVGNGQWSVPIKLNNTSGLNTVLLELQTDNTSKPVGQRNPYWVLGSQAFTPGVPNPQCGGAWYWGNRRYNHTAGVLSGPTNELSYLNLVTVKYLIRGFNQVLGPATNVVPDAITPCLPNCSAIQPLFDRGYRWDTRVTAVSGSPETRIGADWGVTITDPQIGTTMYSTVNTAESPAINPSTGLPDPGITPPPSGGGYLATPGFGSVKSDGAGGLGYPHGLVANPTASPPAITSANTTTFTAGVAGTFNVTAAGVPTPAFTPAPTPLPSGATFTDNSNGTGTLQWNNPTASGQPFSIAITAHNTQSPDATQSFTLRVTAPTITLGVTSGPYVEPASYTLAAHATSGNPITKVDFFSGATNIGTITTDDGAGNYSLTLSGQTAGSYSYTATVTDSLGGAATSSALPLTVAPPSTAAPTPTPASLELIR